MHYYMPRRGVLSLHSSANEGPNGDVSVFFGLSGTGKTTLSADPQRFLYVKELYCFSIFSSAYSKLSFHFVGLEMMNIAGRMMAYSTLREDVMVYMILQFFRSVFNSPILGKLTAKTIDLSEKVEPEIYHAIRFGSVLENVVYDQFSRVVDYTDSELTENTRCAYPIDYIPNAKIPCMGGHPSNIILLTCDAL